MRPIPSSDWGYLLPGMSRSSIHLSPLAIPNKRCAVPQQIPGIQKLPQAGCHGGFAYSKNAMVFPRASGRLVEKRVLIFYISTLFCPYEIFAFTS